MNGLSIFSFEIIDDDDEQYLPNHMLLKLDKKDVDYDIDLDYWDNNKFRRFIDKIKFDIPTDFSFNTTKTFLTMSYSYKKIRIHEPNKYVPPHYNFLRAYVERLEDIYMAIEHYKTHHTTGIKYYSKLKGI